MKVQNLSQNDDQIFNSLIKYGILDNLFEVLSSILKVLNDESKNSSNKNFNIYVDTLKNILKVFEILCSQSNDIANLVLNMNILEKINIVLFKELNILDHNKSKFSSSSVSIFADFFALLISLFPSTNFSKTQILKKENFKIKIMSDHNKIFYTYFSEKMLPLLVTNIVNMPSTATTLQVIRLLELFVIFSRKDLIITFIDPVKLSNISSSMLFIKILELLDSRDPLFIHKILFLVDSIMMTCPENFVEPLIREGVVDHIKNISQSEDESFYIIDKIDKRCQIQGSKYDKFYNQFNLENDFNMQNYNLEMLNEDEDSIVDKKDKIENKNCAETVDAPKINSNVNEKELSGMKNIFTKKNELLESATISIIDNKIVLPIDNVKEE